MNVNLRSFSYSRLSEFAWERISQLEENSTFTVQSLFSPEEYNSITKLQLQYLNNGIQFDIRVMDTSITENSLTETVTELKTGQYQKKVPVFDFNTSLFNKDTPIQTLFQYVIKVIKQDINNTDRFKLSDIFPGYVWSRFTQSQKATLGEILERYNYYSKAYFAKVGISPQKQNIYRGLIDRATGTKEEWYDVNVTWVTIFNIETKVRLVHLMTMRERDERKKNERRRNERIT